MAGRRRHASQRRLNRTFVVSSSRSWAGAGTVRSRLATPLLLDPVYADGCWMHRWLVSQHARFGSCAVLISLLGTGLSSCAQTGDQRRATLRRTAEELIPAEARIRALDYGNCVELASSPSCAGVVFELPERAASRRDRVVGATAERHGATG